MNILAYRTSQGYQRQVLIEESTEQFINSDKIELLLDFLTEPFTDVIRICWNLDATVSLLLRLLSKEQCDKLRTTHKLHLPPYSLFYIPEKVFIVKHIPSRYKSSLYGIQRYFPSIDEPDDLQEIHIAGLKLLYELKKMGMQPTKLTSPIAIYDECIMSDLDLPLLKDMPIEVAELAWKCSGRLWIEAHKIGYFEKVWDYDISSAFPTIAQCLRDFRFCEWVQATKRPKKAVYGYVESDVVIYDWVMVHPILVEVEDGLIAPTGEFSTELDLNKMKFIDNWKIGEYKIKNGWWAIPKSKDELPKPLYLPMQKLLKYKERTGIQATLAKGMSTGVYGKFGEEWDKQFGNHFNPCWFNEISSQCAVIIGDWLYANKIGAEDNEGYRHLVHIGVDGVMLDCPVEEANK